MSYKRKYVHKVTSFKPLSLCLPREKWGLLTDRLDMSIPVDWDVKPQIKTRGPYGPGSLT